MKKCMIHTRIYMTSLVGILGTPPVSFGNYCSVKEGYLINLWAENLEDLTYRKILDDTMEALEFGDGLFLVTDPRIPLEYLHNNKPCFTGSPGLKSEEYEELYRYLNPNLPKDKCPCESGIGINWHSYVGDHKVGTCLICNKKHTEKTEQISMKPFPLGVTWEKTTELVLSPELKIDYLEPTDEKFD